MLKDMKTHTHLKPVRMKTVEIVVDERPCDPNMRHRDKDVVAVMAPFTNELLWYVKYGAIVGGPLEMHIHVDASVIPVKSKKHLQIDNKNKLKNHEKHLQVDDRQVSTYR